MLPFRAPMMAKRFSVGGGGVPPAWYANGVRNSGTAAINIASPAGVVADDIGILLVKTTNEALATPSGWTALYTPTGTGTAAAIGSVRLYAFWARATGTTFPTGLTADSGNMQSGIVMGFRGCVTTGTPFEAVTTSVVSVATTAVSIPNGTTLGADRLVVSIAGIGSPDAINTANTSDFANGDLVSFAEIVDDATSSGNGGGYVGAAGAKTSAGAVGNSTATLANAAAQERLSFALIPA